MTLTFMATRHRNHSIRDSAVGDVRFASRGLQKVSAAAARRGQIFASNIEPSVSSPHLHTSCSQRRLFRLPENSG